MAVEFIPTDLYDMETSKKLWQFCLSLMDTVLALHQQAHMLHGHLKPANLRWWQGVVRLIDFEHAQGIAQAQWAPGTDGFQAPEI